jgi:hypothetical protein
MHKMMAGIVEQPEAGQRCILKRVSNQPANLRLNFD